MPGFSAGKGSKRRGGGGKVSSAWNGLIGDQAEAENISGASSWAPSLSVAAARGGGGGFFGK
jgi:hypothetical protein